MPWGSLVQPLIRFQWKLSVQQVKFRAPPYCNLFSLSLPPHLLKYVISPSFDFRAAPFPSPQLEVQERLEISNIQISEPAGFHQRRRR